MTNMKVKQSVEYEGKKIPLPFLIAKETLNTDMTKVRNRFSGQSIEMPAFAVAVYDTIIGSEALATGHDNQVGESGHSFIWDDVRAGLDWFRKYFPKQYMVLLD